VPEHENQTDPRYVLANVKLSSLEQLTPEHLCG
jgi:sugar-phosphatase